MNVSVFKLLLLRRRLRIIRGNGDRNSISYKSRSIAIFCVHIPKFSLPRYNRGRSVTDDAFLPVGDQKLCDEL